MAPGFWRSDLEALSFQPPEHTGSVWSTAARFVPCSDSILPLRIASNGSRIIAPPFTRRRRKKSRVSASTSRTASI